MLGGSRPGCGQGEELEAAHDRVRQNAKLLPDAVGGVVVGRHDVQSKLSLELSQRFLLRTAPSRKRLLLQAALGAVVRPGNGATRMRGCSRESSGRRNHFQLHVFGRLEADLGAAVRFPAADVCIGDGELSFLSSRRIPQIGLRA